MRKKGKSQNICKKKHKLCFDPSQGYQDSEKISRNPKVPKNNIGFNNRAQSFTTPYYLDVDSPLTHLSNGNTKE